MRGAPRPPLSAATAKKNVRGSVSRVLSGGLPRLCGHSSRRRIAPPLKQPTRATSRNKAHMPPLFGFAPGGVYRAAFRCRGRGALLPHPFDLAGPKTGGLLSVALSLGLPPPGVTRHLRSVEPGLSSPWILLQAAAAQPSDPVYLACPRSRSKSSDKRIDRHSPSICPSISSGRKRRWNAATAALRSRTS